MSENEEMEWSDHRKSQILSAESSLIIPSDDPRVALVHRIVEKLINALDDEGSTISCARWPRDEPIVGRAQNNALPCARASTSSMPFRPETSNPEKVIEETGWDLYISE